MSFWKKLFGREEEEAVLDPIADLVLDKLKPGYLVDYDARTWEVKAQHRIDTGDGFRTDEWELASDSEKLYLDRVEADGVTWSLTRRIPLGFIDERLRRTIEQQGDPPEALDYEGVRYFMSSYGGAQFYRHGQSPAHPFLYWEYEDEGRQHLLVITQWGDVEFEAFVGSYVEEYQFTSILPGKLK